ncbi:MAG: hypothetical protein HY665_05265 [Chloroflexi bacterium]|nr:hypothetical protein [Chloroflexota bacterium]
MFRHSFFLLGLMALVLAVGCAGGTGEAKAPLGQEFSLAIGQTAEITGQNLKIKFTEVIEDSRCPRGVVCIWEGRVSAVVQIDDGAAYRMVLTEPGLTDQGARETYQKYEFAYHVEPYPEAGKKISPDEYRLLLTVKLR